MKLFAICITNNATAYGGVQTLRQAVLFVFVPFDKNTLGDIVAIRDSSGNIVATYEYDAWGNVTVMDEYGYANISSSFIGNVKSFPLSWILLRHGNGILLPANAVLRHDDL